MTVRHVVLIQLDPDLAQSEVSRLKTELSDLCSAQSDIIEFTVARDLGIVRRNADLILTAEFSTVDSFQHYLDDPQHAEFVQNSLAPVLKGLTSIQH